MVSNSYVVNGLESSFCAKYFVRMLVLYFTVAMGRHFGHLTYVRGLISHSLSPFEQKAFAGAISKGIPNLWRRFRQQVFIVVPRRSFIIYIYIYIDN